jgi:hypothetical protein
MAEAPSEVNATDWANWLGLATGAGALLLWGVAGSRRRHAALAAAAPMFFLLCAGHRLRLGVARHHPLEHRQPRLPASLCGQLIVSETLFALAYSFAWDGRWPSATEEAAPSLLFTLGILASIKAHR